MQFFTGLWAFIKSMFKDEPVTAWLFVAAVLFFMFLAPVATLIMLAVVVGALWAVSALMGLDWSEPEGE